MITKIVGDSGTPVLLKGDMYNGWQADAQAGPDICYDGTQYVLTTSIWSVGNSQWASVFFTSPDMVNWTYVPNSLLEPVGSDQIIGNSAIKWFNGNYYFAYGHYTVPVVGGLKVGLSYSPDLINWTTITDPLVINGFDVNLSINPVSGKLEFWYVTNDADYTRSLHMWDSTNGSAWTSNGTFLLFSSPYSGAPAVFYIGNVRYMVHDLTTGFLGDRHIHLVHSVLSDTTWIDDGTILWASGVGWRSSQVSDCTIIVTDLGDGYGTIPRMIYVGSDNTSIGDNTNSSLGLVSIVDMSGRQDVYTMAQTGLIPPYSRPAQPCSYAPIPNTLVDSFVNTGNELILLKEYNPTEAYRVHDITVTSTDTLTHEDYTFAVTSERGTFIGPYPFDTYGALPTIEYDNINLYVSILRDVA